MQNIYLKMRNTIIMSVVMSVVMSVAMSVVMSVVVSKLKLLQPMPVEIPLLN